MIEIASLSRRGRPLLLGVFTSILALNIVACGGGGGNGGGDGPGVPAPPPPPPVNRAPVLTGPNYFSFDENTDVSVRPQLSDPDGDSLTLELTPTADSISFEMDSDGTITGPHLTLERYDYEVPADEDKDNIYRLEVVASDGRLETAFNISIEIRDVENVVTCGSDQPIVISENVTGQFFHLKAEETDPTVGAVDWPEYPRLFKSGSYPADDFSYSLSIVPLLDSLNRLAWGIRTIEPPNFETIADPDQPYVIRGTMEVGGTEMDCELELTVKDVSDEVKAGLKISGDWPEIGLSGYPIGDLDNDGRAEIWFSTFTVQDEKPWIHNGYVIFGHAMNDLLASSADEEIVISDLDASNSIKFSGSFPQIASNWFVGNHLAATDARDIDGDGIPDLVLGLETPENAGPSATADRPLAYVIWGEPLLNASGGLVNLNTLTPSQGLVIGGMGGINRRDNTVASGDVDADGIPDVIVGIPEGEIRASGTSVFNGLVFVVRGSFLRQAKAGGFVDLLTSVSSIDPDEILLLTAEDEYDSINRSDVPLLVAGRDLKVLGDLDGDGGDEFAISAANIQQGVADLGIIRSSVAANARGNAGMIRYSDISVGDIDIVRTMDFPIPAHKPGDFDGDGALDLIFSIRDKWTDTPLAVLMSGRELLKDRPDVVVDLVEFDNRTKTFSVDHRTSTPETASFFPDIDGDGRDEIIISYSASDKIDDVPVNRSGIAFVLGSTIADMADGADLSLNDLEPGEGLIISGGIFADQRAGPTMAHMMPVADIDGDGSAELLISDLGAGREGYILLSVDLINALSTGVHVSLDALFRAQPDPVAD